METITDSAIAFYENLSPGVIIVACIMLFIGTIGMWALFSKSKLPGIACIVPVWNVAVFLKIMGRPAWHMLYFLIPVYNIYFIVVVWIELCQSFGKTSKLDYVLVILLNGLYVMNLALSYDTKYVGPAYQMKLKAAVKNTAPQGSPQLA